MRLRREKQRKSKQNCLLTPKVPVSTRKLTAINGRRSIAPKWREKYPMSTGELFFACVVVAKNGVSVRESVTLRMQQLCNGDKQRALLFQVFAHHSHSPPTLVSLFVFEPCWFAFFCQRQNYCRLAPLEALWSNLNASRNCSWSTRVRWRKRVDRTSRM